VIICSQDAQAWKTLQSQPELQLLVFIYFNIVILQA
jgi:hypothetical protein